MHVRGNRIQVQFERIRPGLLHLLSVVGPTANRGAVETGNNGDVHGFLGFANMLEIAFGSEVKRGGLWEIGERLGIALRTVREVVMQPSRSRVNCSSKSE